jgi:hypothetical protein
MPTWLLSIHSLVRWLVMIAAVAGLVWYGLVWAKRAHNARTDRVLMSAFTGLMDLEVTIGVILIIWVSIAQNNLLPFRVEHGVTMFIGALVGHSSVMWRKREESVRARNYVITILVVLVIIFIGVSRLPYNPWGNIF